MAHENWLFKKDYNSHDVGPGQKNEIGNHCTVGNYPYYKKKDRLTKYYPLLSKM